MENTSGNEILVILSGIIALINGIMLVYAGWKKLKPEVKKMEIEGDSELAEASNLNLEGAKISGQMLLDRINELKAELAAERQLRKDQVEGLEKARKEDAEYFRRRIRDVERDARDVRAWAAKLHKQVLEAKLIPAPFVPSYNDSDPKVTAIRTELERDPEADK